MTTPDEPGIAEPGSENDPGAAEAYAESVGINPTQEEIDTYLEIAGGTSRTDPSGTADTDE